MSGGVDSSVAALLVQQAGYEAMGVTLRLHGEGRGPDPAEDARAAAARLGLDFTVLDFSGSFREQVVERFVAAYQRGETPNPCIDCNRYVKFGRLMAWAREQGFAKVASGHYARVEQDAETGRWLLKKGLDPRKDQSYVLYALTQEELSMLLLPLGGLTKAQVRQLAQDQGFENAGKQESQDICFIPDGDYAGFIQRYAGRSFPPGAFVGTAGQVYGEHRGIIHYTVGQRKGLGLSFPQPMYVCKIALLPGVGGGGVQPHRGGKNREAPAGEGQGALPPGGAARHGGAGGPGDPAGGVRRAPAGHHQGTGGGALPGGHRGGGRHHRRDGGVERESLWSGKMQRSWW